MKQTSKIFVAGHRGLVGSAILRHLRALSYTNIITCRHAELDLTDQAAVNAFFDAEKPEYIFLAAAKVGGIMANNTYPADFIRENLLIQTNVIDAAYHHGVKKLLFLGSSCIYPRMAPQPMKEEYLLTGPLEPTNSAYAIAKIAGIETCRSYNRQHGTHFVPVMPTNLYGPNDNFDLFSSHVLPAMIRKFHLAKLASQGNFEAIDQDEARFGPIPDDIRTSLSSSQEIPKVTLWGTGQPRREFLYADDLADACVYLMKNYEETELVNIGTGRDHTIRELAEKVRDIVGFKGEMVFDTSKPDGTPKKLLDVSKLEAIGWQAKIRVDQGIQKAYEWYASF
ncbi:GDP-L-fucose synthase family protein [Desulfonema magnum]|uniref:GDP-L-fucose synthase n=1 Tax=Desulfonema magnum TaxID=45655 RepID=A0A975GKR4_9BACT|nr:GDP-L-fucose synthase [Desulfonema magnum]QTA84942.1 GDP-4-keto-6-deoxy-D-mannose-3,5-epimerase-4-reductase [Desulfonema magnum]